LSGRAGDTRDMRAQNFWGFPLYGQHYGDSHLTTRCTKKGHLPTFRPSSKTKPEVQA